MDDKKQKHAELVKQFTELDRQLRQLLHTEYSRAGIEGRVIFELMPEQTQHEVKRLTREMDEVRRQGQLLEREMGIEA